MLARFLGHDIAVHREFYRLPENTLQVAKVGKLLHCINNGTIADYRGKNFDEIQIDQNETVPEEICSDSEDNGEESELPAQKIQSPKNSVVDDECASDAVSSKVNLPKINNKRKIVADKSESGKKRHCWSIEEKDAIRRQFGDHLKLRKIPNKLDCDNALRCEPILSAHHSWKAVKYCVKNMICSHKKTT